MSVHFQQPIMAPTMFSENSFPPVNLNIPQELNPILSRVIITLLNRIQETCRANPSRMASLNLLAQNNFQNETFPYWVEFCLRFTVQKAIAANNLQALPAYVNEAVDETLALMSSFVARRFPEVYNSCNYQVQSAANSNVPKLQGLQESLFQINLMGITQQPQATPLTNNYSQSYASAHQMPSAVPTGSSWASNTQQQHQQANTQQQSSWGQNSQTTAVPSGSTWAANVATSKVNEAPTPFFQESNNEPKWYDSVQTEATPVSTSHKQTIEPDYIPEHAYVKEERGIETVKARGGYEVDVNNHALPYFGSNVLVDLSARTEDLRLDALQIGRDGRKTEEDFQSVLINKTVEYVGVIQEAFINSRVVASRLRSSNKEAHTLYRQFFTALNPVPCLSSARLMMEGFKQNRAVEELPNIFRNFIEKAIDPNNPTFEDQEALNFYTYIDRCLGRSITHYLVHNQGLKSAKLSNFAAGISDLYKFFRDKGKTDNMHLFNAWVTRLLNSLQREINENAEEFLDKTYQLPEDYTMGYYPETHSVTLLNLTTEELGYKIGNEPMKVDAKITPNLASIASSLTRNKKDLGIFTNHDWLVTVDDDRFQFVEDAFNPGEVLIYKP